MRPPPIIISASDYVYHTEQNDGVCSVCYKWSLGNTQPDQEHGLCQHCHYRGLCGINVARILELILVQ